MNYEEIGKNIKKYRAGKMTQAELAARIGRSESSIRKYEKGLTEIPNSVIENIAEILDVSLADLLGITHKSQQALEILENLRNGSKDFLESMENILLDNFNCLNLEGKEKALEQVNLLTKIPEYRKGNK